MASPWPAIALVAGVAAASSSAVADPIVSPRQVDPAPKAKVAKAAPVKSAKAARPAAKPAKAARPTGKSTKGAKATKAARPAAKSAKVSARSAPPARRGDNMPAGFAWPATPTMLAAGKACEAELDALGVTWQRAAAEGRMADPIEVPDGLLGGVKYTSLWRSPPHKLDCQLARALAQIGADLHALGVREVRWGSIYRWSNVRTGGEERPFLSRHALGLAMDIVEFVDDTGRVANVQQHYLGGDALLAGVEQVVNGSGKFRLMLTPKNDPKSHHDHFHVEANPSYAAP